MEPLFYINSKEELTDEEIEAYEATFIDYMTTLEVLYLEGKSEGLIFGIGSKIFSLIGSVISIGIVSSIAFGFIYYLIKVIA